MMGGCHPGNRVPTILVVDNYDSFVHNLARYFRLLGCETVVARNDAIAMCDAVGGGFDAAVLSPGPGTPSHAGICVPLLRAAPADLPVLGVCLGHQALAEAFGGTVVRSEEPTHGEASPVHHRGGGLFAGLPSPFSAGRYHSLVAEPPLPACLRLDAWLADGTAMGIAHRERPLFGVQFHPESVLTAQGMPLLRNFLAEVTRRTADGAR